MKKILPLAITTLLAACGGGSSLSSDPTTPTPTTPDSQQTTFSFAVSDAPVDDALAVVVTITAVDLIREDNDDDSESNVTRLVLDPVQTVNLLDYQGSASLSLINDIEVDAGDYEQLRLVISDDMADTYFENDQGVFELRVPSGSVKLGPVSLGEGENEYIAEFNLRRSVVFNPGPNRYQLKPTGIRLVNDDDVGTISGTVEANLFTVGECAGKTDAATGNTVYLYAGADLAGALLEDEMEADLLPDGQALPYASANITLNEDNTYGYEFGQVEAGEYTLAFTCNAAGDDPETDDVIIIPLPENTLTTVSVAQGQNTTHNFTE